MGELTQPEPLPRESLSQGDGAGGRTTRLPLDSRGLAGVLLALAIVGVVLPFGPGLVSFDTRVSLIDADTGAPVDWYTPFGSLVWGWFMKSGLGLGTAFAAQTALIVLTLYGLLRLAVRRVAAALAAGVICAYPPMYAQLSNLSRDTLFLGFALLAFLAYARARNADGSRRPALLVAAFAAATVAFLYRQNGIAVLLVVLCAVAFDVLSARDWRPAREWLGRVWPALPALGAALAGVLLVTTLTGAAYSVLPVKRTHSERHLFIYDLAAITDATGESQFPPELQARPHGVTPQDMSAATVERRFDYSTVLALYEPYGDWDTDFTNERLASAETVTLREGWIDAVADHPREYTWARLRMTASQLGLVRRPTDAFYGIVAARNFDNPLEFTSAYDRAVDYVEAWVGPTAAVPLDLPWPYLLLATACALVVRRRSGELGRAAVVMAAALWVNLASLGVGSAASSFRYTSLAVPVALVLAVYAFAARTPRAA